MVFYNNRCWNVKSLGNLTEFNIKLLNVIETMSVMALAEVQWVGTGVLDVDDAVVVYSGMNVKQSGNQRGTGIILRNEFKEAWKKNCVFRPINERLLQVRVKIGGFGISLIAVYAPTEVDESENSEKFYETLESTIESICKKDVIIVADDFNARVGQPTSRSSLNRKHNPDVRNNNGRRLVDFCNYNNLAITNTLFPHKKIHQYTWHHPGQKNGEHVLDYILINAQYRYCILDTKVFRKTLHITDHFPVIKKFKFFKSLS